jgi:MFS family permease
MGSSGIMNGTMTIVHIVSPPDRRAMGLGIVMALYGLGQLLGPLVSGGITEHASWRWCFCESQPVPARRALGQPLVSSDQSLLNLLADINLPLGALAVACFAFIKLPTYARKPWTLRTLFWDLDTIGFIILAPACVMLLLAVQWGGNEYAWNSATVIGMLCGSVVVFAIFAVWEMRLKDQAMLPSNILKLRPVAFALLVAFLQGGGMLILSYYLPLWFQAVQNVSPTMSGVRLLPLFIGQLVAAAVVGVLSAYAYLHKQGTADLLYSVEVSISCFSSHGPRSRHDRCQLRALQLNRAE